MKTWLFGEKITLLFSPILLQGAKPSKYLLYSSTTSTRLILIKRVERWSGERELK
jgi:hypothetical protein